MADVTLVWVTPNAEQLIAYMARVSNPKNQDNKDFEKLIRYMLKNKHFSPFEMVSACFEINTTRDIGRQILRHRSFSFQEFSQRYSDVNALMPAEKVIRECRLQDTTNRQNSLTTDNQELTAVWNNMQQAVNDMANSAYNEALALGIAKEQARSLLPEGLTPSRMYMSGTLRSWIHYLNVRRDEHTQKEHREIADAISAILSTELPSVMSAAKA